MKCYRVAKTADISTADTVGSSVQERATEQITLSARLTVV